MSVSPLLRSNDKKWLDELWRKIDRKMSAECDRIGERLPYISVNGVPPRRSCY